MVITRMEKTEGQGKRQARPNAQSPFGANGLA
jgi:hypothetical protein